MGQPLTVEALELSCEIAEKLITNKEWLEVQPNGLQIDVQSGPYGTSLVATLWDKDGSDPITDLNCDVKTCGTAVQSLRKFAAEVRP